MKGILSILLLLSFQLSNGQNAKDYFNKEVQEGQGATTDKIMSALEKGENKIVIQYFNIEIKNLESTLNTSVKEIKKIKDITQLSIVIVYDNGHNIYRCRYSNKDGSLFQIDLHFMEGNPKSKVIKVEIKTADILKREKEIRMGQNAPPPPPPFNK